jgi:hypothetical protein
MHTFLLMLSMRAIGWIRAILSKGYRLMVGYCLRAVFRRFIPFSAGKTENESLDALLTDYNSYLRKTVQRYCFLAIYARKEVGKILGKIKMQKNKHSGTDIAYISNRNKN